MKDELEIVANELLVLIEQLVYDNLKIERVIFLECGASAFDSMYARSLPDSDLGREDKFEEAELRFDRLQQAAPLLISQILRKISISYGIVTNLINKNFDDHGHLNEIRGLMEASMYFWQAIPMLEVTALSSVALDVIAAQKTVQLSAAGTSGADARHSLSRELRDWACAQDKIDWKNCTESARKLVLAEVFPKKFVNVFDDPVAIIAGALRKMKKEKKQMVVVNYQDV